MFQAWGFSNKVYKLLGIDKKPTEMYHGSHHIDVLFDAAKKMVK